MKGKIKFIVTGVVVVIILAVAVFAGPTIGRVANSAALFAKGTPVIEIAQINDGFVPQGLDFYGDAEAGTGRLYTCGYKADGSASLVFAADLVEGEAGEIMSARMVDLDGEMVNAHCGGLAVDDTHVYVCGDAVVNVFDRGAFDRALESGGAVEATALIDPGFAPAFVLVDNGKLYAGEFYRLPNYPSPESHHMSVSNGENHAIMVAYDEDKASDTGYAATPSTVYSLPDLVQGACFVDGDTLLTSCSWGLDTSHIISYNVSAADTATFELDGVEVPLVILDAKCEKTRNDVPLFAEEIVVLQNRLLINSEAACNKYIVGKLYGANMMRSFDLDALKG